MVTKKSQPNPKPKTDEAPPESKTPKVIQLPGKVAKATVKGKTYTFRVTEGTEVIK